MFEPCRDCTLLYFESGHSGRHNRRNPLAHLDARFEALLGGVFIGYF
jgi:hypothetical protein